LPNINLKTITKTEMKAIPSSSNVAAPNDIGKKLFLFAVLVAVVGAAAYFVSKNQIILLFGGVLAILAGYLLFKKPEFATLVFAAILYANIAVIGVQLYRVPQIVAAGVSGLLVLPLANYLLVRRDKLIFNAGFFLALLYGAALVAASLLARDMNIAMNELGNFAVEGLVLYFLLINVIREMPTLKRVIWTLLFVGGILGGLSLFQEATKTYENNYGGLAQKSDDIDMAEVKFDEFGGSRRAGGPLGKENRYAQIMVVIFPLALCMAYIEPARKMRLLALAAAGLILGGIVLTFSRGAFVTLAGMVLIMVLLRYIRPTQALGGVALLVVVILTALPEYVERVSSVSNLSSLAANDSEGAREADGSLRGRFAQNLAAVRAFVEHPILGVGPGHFAKFYSARYGNEVGTKRLNSNRRAHSLYLEMLADTGLVGTTAFMAIVFAVVRRLWQARRRFAQNRPELAHIATAFLLGIFNYFGTATFLHLSYQRYYWFLMALACAAIRIFTLESAASQSQQPPAVAGQPMGEEELTLAQA
jgi:O-antigen ligase